MHLSIGALKVAHYLSTVPTGMGLTIPEDVCPKADKPSIHTELTAAGLLVNDGRSSVHAGFTTSPSATVKLRALAKQYRQAAIQLEIMTGIRKDSSGASTDKYFPLSGVNGGPVERHEYNRAVNQLCEWDLIRGQRYPNDGLILTRLTADGEAALDSELSPQGWIAENRQGGNMTSYSINQNFNDAVGAVQNGDHNTVNVQQNTGVNAESFASILAEIRQIIATSEVDTETGQTAEDVLDAIEAQALNGGSPGVIKTFLTGLTNSLPPALAGQVALKAGKALELLFPATQAG